ncbi:MAG: hypothetical protein N3A69_11865, partial [Leptospiraceae bacterium]|nr:hypothetical protein [Leptospiraceae bacterium]
MNQYKLIAVSLIALQVFTFGCKNKDDDKKKLTQGYLLYAIANQPKRVSYVDFQEISIPNTPEEIKNFRFSPKMTVFYEDGGKQEFELRAEKFIETGQEIGGNVFGRVLNKNGQNFTLIGYSQKAISHNVDANSIVKAGNKYFLITQMEDLSGMVYATEIDPITLEARKTFPINFSSIGGITTTCAGFKTPYQT